MSVTDDEFVIERYGTNMKRSIGYNYVSEEVQLHNLDDTIVRA